MSKRDWYGFFWFAGYTLFAGVVAGAYPGTALLILCGYVVTALGASWLYDRLRRDD